MRGGRTIFIPCHSDRLSAYTPALAFSLSTRRIVDSGTVSLTLLRSRLAKVRYGGMRCSRPVCVRAELQHAGKSVKGGM